jgi:hypothetical protein
MFDFPKIYTAYQFVYRVDSSDAIYRSFTCGAALTRQIKYELESGVCVCTE